MCNDSSNHHIITAQCGVRVDYKWVLTTCLIVHHTSCSGVGYCCETGKLKLFQPPAQEFHLSLCIWYSIVTVKSAPDTKIPACDVLAFLDLPVPSLYHPVHSMGNTECTCMFNLYAHIYIYMYVFDKYKIQEKSFC